VNEVDLPVLLVLGVSIYYGALKGLINGAVDLFSLLAALILGALTWRIGAVFPRWFGASEALAGLLGFVLVTIAAAVGAGYLGLWLLRKVEIPKNLDRVGGGLFGGIFGLLFSALLLIFSGIMPKAYEAIPKSALGPRLIQIVPALHVDLERAGVALPKLILLPLDYRDEVGGVRQGLQFLQINFSRLEGATCLKCGNKVKFLGYKFKRGTLLSPKFQCPVCGRTTDGCQTFEGFHKIYGKCPIDLAKEGLRFDCGVWTNGDFITPKGVCPIDGKTLEGSEAVKD
jgi:uncharacterized membrane protein required for colicin V production